MEISNLTSWHLAGVKHIREAVDACVETPTAWLLLKLDAAGIKW